MGVDLAGGSLIVEDLLDFNLNFFIFGDYSDSELHEISIADVKYPCAPCYVGMLGYSFERVRQKSDMNDIAVDFVSDCLDFSDSDLMKSYRVEK